MYVPGVMCIVSGLLVIYPHARHAAIVGPAAHRKIPQRLSTLASREKEKSDISAKEILWNYVLRNKFIWVLAIAYFFIYIIRTALNDWSMMYLKEVKGYSSLIAGSCVCWFEVGGFFGSLAAGWGRTSCSAASAIRST